MAKIKIISSTENVRSFTFSNNNTVNKLVTGIETTAPKNVISSNLIKPSFWNITSTRPLKINNSAKIIPNLTNASAINT